MIEDEAALENLEQIFTVRGIDLFFVGRVDLTVSLGETDLASPVVEDAMNLILAKASENKVSLGMFSPTSADAKLLVSRGVRFLLMGSDTMFLNRGATELTRSVTG
jgi:2-keto-3-deoxy-L-rhamnonate aldolase RhmA